MYMEIVEKQIREQWAIYDLFVKEKFQKKNLKCYLIAMPISFVNVNELSERVEGKCSKLHYLRENRNTPLSQYLKEAELEAKKYGNQFYLTSFIVPYGNKYFTLGSYFAKKENSRERISNNILEKFSKEYKMVEEITGCIQNPNILLDSIHSNSFKKEILSRPKFLK